MRSNKTVYTEIAKAQISKRRNIVISDCSRGGFTIAMQAIIQDEDMEVPVFMRGAFHVNDLQGLYNLRDTLNYVIQTVEAREEDEDDWDEE